MKLLFYMTFTVLLIVNCVEDNEDKDQIIIKAFSYENSNKLPAAVDTFYLKVEKMKGYDTDLFSSYIYYDTVYNSELLINSDLYQNFGPGRYIISAKRNGFSDLIDIYYKGGDIELRMILK